MLHELMKETCLYGDVNIHLYTLKMPGAIHRLYKYIRKHLQQMKKVRSPCLIYTSPSRNQTSIRIEIV